MSAIGVSNNLRRKVAGLQAKVRHQVTIAGVVVSGATCSYEDGFRIVPYRSPPSAHPRLSTLSGRDLLPSAVHPMPGIPLGGDASGAAGHRQDGSLMRKGSFHREIALAFAILAWGWRMKLVETPTRHQMLVLVGVAVVAEVTVVAAIQRGASLRSLCLNVMAGAGAMILAKWQIEGINWASAARKLVRLVAALQGA